VVFPEIAKIYRLLFLSGWNFVVAFTGHGATVQPGCLFYRINSAGAGRSEFNSGEEVQIASIRHMNVTAKDSVLIE
jgi:hypothetical protein